MIKLSKMAYEALREQGSDRIPINPKEWWKKSKPATIWTFICLFLEIPFALLKYIIMAICFIPHAIYEKLDN